MSDESSDLNVTQPVTTLFHRESDADGLLKVLNSHGYGFQYATLKRCLEVGRDPNAAVHYPWLHAVAEYPVTLNDQQIHIDFVLGSGTHLLVAECKRTERWRWGFARGFSSNPDSALRPRADYLEWAGGAVLVRQAMCFGPKNAPFDIAVELKNQGDKSPPSTSRTAIDASVSQVMRARGGLIEELGRGGILRYGGGAVIPVIFTTAPLVVTNTQMASANPRDGRLQSLDASIVEWVWFDHHLSRDLRPTGVKHRAPPNQDPPTKSEFLRDSLNRDITRSVAIVNEAGIEGFIRELRMLLDSDRTAVGYEDFEVETEGGPEHQ